MFKQVIKYKNFEDEDREITAYFHMSKADLVQLAAEDWEQKLTLILLAENKAGMIDTFRELIKRSYGRRDGDSFIKDDVATGNFMGSPAFDELLMSLVTVPGASVEFIENLMPTAMREKLRQELDRVKDPSAVQTPQPEAPSVQTVELPSEMDQDTRPAWLREGRPPSEMELVGASKDELMAAFRMRLSGGKSEL